MGLGSLALFESVPVEVLSSIEAGLSQRAVGCGQVLVRAGEPSDFFGIVISGSASVERVQRGRTLQVASLREGDIFGELGMLLNQPRNSSVVATSEMGLLTGGATVFERLLDIDLVHDRVRDLVSRRLADDVIPVPVTLENDVTLGLRPLLPSDRSAFFQAAREASPELLYSRFFSAGSPSIRVLNYLVDIDFINQFAWVCTDAGGSGIGVGRYVRSRENPRRAEFAVTVAEDWHGAGVGALLLGACCVAAQEADVEVLTADFLSQNTPVKRLLLKAGAEFGKSHLGVTSAEFSPVSGLNLLGVGDAQRLRSAVADVVNAAGLALRH